MSSKKDTPHLSLYYLEYNPAGEPAVLLLHGLGATCDSWQLQIPALTRAGFHVIAPDARGFGRSPYQGGKSDVQEWVRDLWELLDSLPQKGLPTRVVGISMGGVFALQLALERPDLIGKLVLINTFARLRPKSPRIWWFFLVRFLLAHTIGIPTQARAVAKRLLPRPEQEVLRQALIDQILQADPRAYRAAMRALAFYNASHRLAEIQIPTLVITAENDSTVPPELQKELACGIPGARHEIIPNAGHAAIVEQPELINRILVDFLK